MKDGIKKIDIVEILNSKAPCLLQKIPKIFRGLFINILSKLLVIKQVNNFIQNSNIKQGIDFIEAIFNELNVKFDITQEDLSKILPRAAY